MEDTMEDRVVFCPAETEEINDLCVYLRMSLHKWGINGQYDSSCKHFLKKSNRIVDMICKQELLDPIKNEYGIYECPVCHGTNIDYLDEMDCVEIEHNFCPDCGQALRHGWIKSENVYIRQM